MQSRVQVLMSTMNIKNETEYKKLLNKNKIQSPIITVNQVQNNKDIFHIENGDKKLYSYKESGASKSRNKLLEKAQEGICVFADDDVEYVPNYEKIILEEYNKNKNADMIIFLAENQNPQREKVKKIGNKKINRLDSMKVRTYEITFKTDVLKKCNIKFDNNFGPGGIFSKGEETIFISDLLKKGIKIYSTNKKIVSVRDEKSSWFTGFNKKYLYDQGAIFYRIEPKFYFLLILQYVIRKHSLYKHKLSILQAYKQLMAGAKECKKVVCQI